MTSSRSTPPDAAPVIDVAHPCWTGVEDEFDHEWTVEEWDQGDPSTPYYQCTWSRVCKDCGEVDEEWEGHDDSDGYYPEEWHG